MLVMASLYIDINLNFMMLKWYHATRFKDGSIKIYNNKFSGDESRANLHLFKS